MLEEPSVPLEAQWQQLPGEVQAGDSVLGWFPSTEIVYLSVIISRLTMAD